MKNGVVERIDHENRSNTIDVLKSINCLVIVGHVHEITTTLSFIFNIFVVVVENKLRNTRE